MNDAKRNLIAVASEVGRMERSSSLQVARNLLVATREVPVNAGCEATGCTAEHFRAAPRWSEAAASVQL